MEEEVESLELEMQAYRRVQGLFDGDDGNSADDTGFSGRCQ